MREWHRISHRKEKKKKHKEMLYSRGRERERERERESVDDRDMHHDRSEDYNTKCKKERKLYCTGIRSRERGELA